MILILNNISGSISVTPFGKLLPGSALEVKCTLQQFKSAKTALDTEVSASRLSYSFNEISVRDFGAIGNGVADDTAAIVAGLEFANSLTAGTWATGGDTVGANVERKRFPLHFPTGKYRTTAAIPVRFRGVQIVGPDTSAKGDGVFEGYTATILCDHTTDGFALDCNFDCQYFSVRNIRLLKAPAHAGTGNGIKVTGPNYNWGPHLEGMMIRAFNDGVHIEPQDAASGTGAGAELEILNCSIDANTGYGVYVSGHAGAGSRIVGNSIVQNGTGGIHVGGKGLVVASNDLEGQPRPLEITGGSNSTAVTIENNYFEAVSATTTEGCIVLGTTHGFSVRNNTYSVGITVPHVVCRDSSRGVVDEDAQLEDATNVVVSGRLLIPTAGTSNLEMSACWNPRQVVLPQSATVPSNLTIAGPVSQVVATPNYRVLISGGPTSWANGSYLVWGVAIKYGTDLPHGPVLSQVLGTISGTEATRAAESVQPPTDCVKVGDTAVYMFAAKNTTGSTITSVRYYISPYGSDTTTALGAEISSVVGYTTASISAGLPVLNVLDILKSQINVKSFGAVGDGVANDTPAIQAAIDAVGAIGGGEVFFPPGTYKVIPVAGGNPALTIGADNVKLKGAGRGQSKLVFRVAGDLAPATNWELITSAVWRGYMIRITGTNVSTAPRKNITIEGLDLDGGAGWQNTLYPIDGGPPPFPANTSTGNGWDLTHKAIYIEENKYHENISVKDCAIHGFRGELVYYGGAGLGRITVADCELYDANGSMVSMTGNLICIRNKFHDGPQLVECDHRTNDNWFEDNEFSNAQKAVTIASSLDLSSGQSWGRCHISKNTFRLVPQDCVFITGYSRNVDVVNNQFIDCGTLIETGAVRVQSQYTGDPSDIRILDNTFVADTATIFATIYLAGGLKRVRITGNHASRTAAAITASRQTGACIRPILNTSASDIVVDHNTWEGGKKPQVATQSDATETIPFWGQNNRWPNAVDAGGTLSVPSFVNIDVVGPETFTIGNTGSYFAWGTIANNRVQDKQRTVIRGIALNAVTYLPATGAHHTLPGPRYLDNKFLTVEYNAETGKWHEISYTNLDGSKPTANDCVASFDNVTSGPNLKFFGTDRLVLAPPSPTTFSGAVDVPEDTFCVVEITGPNATLTSGSTLDLKSNFSPSGAASLTLFRAKGSTVAREVGRRSAGTTATVFDPRDFGLVDPTGVADSTAAINAALLAAKNSGISYGAVVELPYGTFTISDTLLMGESFGVTLRGQGPFATRIFTTSAVAGKPIIMMRNCNFCAVEGMAVNGLNASKPSVGIEIRNETGHSVALSTKNSVTDVYLGDDTRQILKGISMSGNFDGNNDFHMFTRVHSYGCIEADAAIDLTQSVGHLFLDCNFNGISVGGKRGVWTSAAQDRVGDPTSRGGKFTWRGGSCGGHTIADFKIDGEGPGVNSIEDCNSEGSYRFLDTPVLPGVDSIITMKNIRYASMDGYQAPDNIAFRWQFGGHFELTGSRFDQLGAGLLAKVFLWGASTSTYRIVGNVWNQYGSYEQDMIIKNPYDAAGTFYPGAQYIGEESNTYKPTGTADDDVPKWKGTSRDRGVSVSDFGAVGDGATNDTGAIQRAIDYQRAAGGGTVLFPKPKKCYRITTRLIVGQRWVHEDQIKYAYNMNLTTTTGYDATKRNLIVSEPVVSLVGEDGAEIWGDFNGNDTDGTETALVYFGAGGGSNKGTRPRIENLSFVGKAGYSAGIAVYPGGTTAVLTGQMGLCLAQAGRVEVTRCRFRELNRGVVSTDSYWSRITHCEAQHVNRGLELLIHNAATVSDVLVSYALDYGIVATGQNVRIRGFDTEECVTDIWIPSCDNLSIDGAYLESVGTAFNGYHMLWGDAANPATHQCVWGRIDNVHGSKEYGGNIHAHCAQIAISNTRIYPNLASSARFLIEGTGTQIRSFHTSLGVLDPSSTFQVLEVAEPASTANTGFMSTDAQTFAGTKTFGNLFATTLLRADSIGQYTTPSTLTIRGAPTDNSSAKGMVVGASNLLATSGAKLLSVMNGIDVAPVEKASIDKDGNASLTGYAVAAGGLFSDSLNARSSNTPILIQGQMGDSGSAVSVKIGSDRNYVATGAKLVSFLNNTTEKAFIDKDGSLSLSRDLSVGSGFVQAPTVPLYLLGEGTGAGGSSAVNCIIDGSTTLTGASDALLKVRNNLVDKLIVDKSGNLINAFDVRFYGAKGDGTTNDQAAFQAAVNAVNAIGGGVVYVPAGTYMLTATLAMKEFVTLQGAGRDSTKLKFQINSTSDGITFISPNLGTAYGRAGGLKHLTLHADSTTYVRDMVSMNLWDSAELSYVVMEGAGRYGLNVIDGINSTFTHCKYNSNHDAGLRTGTAVGSVGTTLTFNDCYFTATTNGPGAIVDAIIGCNFFGCIFESNGSADHSTGEGAKVLSAKASFHGCYFENNSQWDIKASGVDATHTAHVVITSPIVVGGAYKQSLRGFFYGDYCTSGSCVGGDFTNSTVPFEFTTHCADFHIVGGGGMANEPVFDRAGVNTPSKYPGVLIYADPATGNIKQEGSYSVRFGAGPLVTQERKGTVSLTSHSLAAGAAETFAVTMDGTVLAGDLVTGVGFSVGMSNLILASAMVTGTNQCYLTLMNVGGGAATIPTCTATVLTRRQT
jgi:polygalacturonase